MKKQIIRMLIAALILLYAVSCSTRKPDLHILKYSGAEQVFNLSRTGMVFGTTSISGETSGIAAYDGDLLFIAGEKPRDQLLYQYRKENGDVLHFSSDSLIPFVLRVNDSLMAVQLGDSLSWNWLAKQPLSTLRAIRSLTIPLPLSEVEKSILKNLAETGTVDGLMIGASDTTIGINELLTLFNPGWVYVDAGTSWTLDAGLASHLTRLETVGLSEGSGDEQTLKSLSLLPNLKNLIAEKSKVVSFSDFKNLSSLMLTRSPVKDARELKLSPSIHSLCLVNCDSLKDVSAIWQLPELKQLGFTGSRALVDLSPLQSMEQISWLACPPYIRQKDFDGLVMALENLQVLELLGCDSVRNLGSLKEKSGLKALYTDSPWIEKKDLAGLQQLWLLAFKPDTGTLGEQQLKDLQAGMPATLVVTGKGFCLGSGWILLIFPMLLIGFLLLRLMRKGTRLQA